jgi:hypothetical protein
VQIDKKKIERSLRKKGFIEVGGRHKYFYHEVKGKRTGAYAYTSRGSGYKTYGDSLLKAMRIELRLDSLNQVKFLLECPMDSEGYNNILREKGVI